MAFWDEAQAQPQGVQAQAARKKNQAICGLGWFRVGLKERVGVGCVV